MPHHWILDKHNKGTCKRCGTVVQFDNNYGFNIKDMHGPVIIKPGKNMEACLKEETVKSKEEAEVRVGTTVVYCKVKGCGGVILKGTCTRCGNHEHDWGTDGQHANEFCKICFINKPMQEHTDGVKKVEAETNAGKDAPPESQVGGENLFAMGHGPEGDFHLNPARHPDPPAHREEDPGQAQLPLDKPLTYPEILASKPTNHFKIGAWYLKYKELLFHTVDTQTIEQVISDWKCGSKEALAKILDNLGRPDLAEKVRSQKAHVFKRKTKRGPSAAPPDNSEYRPSDKWTPDGLFLPKYPGYCWQKVIQLNNGAGTIFIQIGLKVNFFDLDSETRKWLCDLADTIKTIEKRHRKIEYKYLYFRFK